MRVRSILAAFFLATVALLGASAPVAHASASGPVTIDGTDLHDGMVYQDSGTYYMVGTEYGCGYQWYVSSEWCGFGVSTAASLSGPWTAPTLLVKASQINPANGQTWDYTCGTNGGHGCFNPRMLHRWDGVWVLWFNAVDNRSSSTTSAYVVMGCNGPAGPCGAEAGGPHGSTHLPQLSQCNGNNGDFGIGVTGSTAVLICSYGGTLAEEQLDSNWANGTGTGSNGLAGLAGVEGVGAWQDQATGNWIMTYAEKCGYCTGTATGYATASSLLGPWTAPANVGWSAPAGGRRDVSLGCGGQARTVSVVDGVPYQITDTWMGQRNETQADTILSPLTYAPVSGSPGDGHAWVPPVSYACR